MKEGSNTYNNLIIYYFSGTGNARNASKWIKEVAEKQNIRTRLINIDRFDTIDPPDLSEKTLIGFCSPTHGFNLPPLVIKFIRKFPRSGKADVFILNTRGGLKLSKLFLPGLSGLAQILPALLLIMKGYRIVGMQPLDLPSNWLILHPALRNKVVGSMYSHYRGIVEKFAARIISGKRKYKALISVPIDLLLLPVAFGYYIIGRFFLAKTLIATDACNKCGLCIKQCPVRAISIKDDSPYWSYKCESCMRCVSSCPQRAIETMHSFTAGMLLASSFVISPLLLKMLKYLGMRSWINNSWLTENIWYLIDAFIFLAFVFVCYRILHFLMRYRIINRFIKYTSLSTYKFWRRYHPPEKSNS